MFQLTLFSHDRQIYFVELKKKFFEYFHFKKLSHFGAPLLANLVKSQNKVSQNNGFTQKRALICAVLGTTVPKSAHISAEIVIMS